MQSVHARGTGLFLGVVCFRLASPKKLRIDRFPSLWLKLTCASCF